MDDKENIEPPKKRFKLSIHRFGDPKRSPEIAKRYIPSNTVKNTSWALKVFLEWQCAHK